MMFSKCLAPSDYFLFVDLAAAQRSPGFSFCLQFYFSAFQCPRDHLKAESKLHSGKTGNDRGGKTCVLNFLAPSSPSSCHQVSLTVLLLT